MIQESTHLLIDAAVVEQVILKNLAERVTARTINSGQKARECGPMWQLIATKERHKMDVQTGQAGQRTL
jgi:hypothetical protein